MDYKLKLERAKKELNEHGLKAVNSPLLWLANKIGIKLRPPQYKGFFLNFTLISIYYFFIWYVLLSIINKINPDGIYNAMGDEQRVISCLMFGGLIGFMTAATYKWQAIKNNLSQWSEL